jgi:hypothetical protein
VGVRVSGFVGVGVGMDVGAVVRVCVCARVCANSHQGFVSVCVLQFVSSFPLQMVRY